MNNNLIVLNVGDYVGTEFGNGLIKFIGKDFLVLVAEDGKEHCVHRTSVFWLPVEINWEK